MAMIILCYTIILSAVALTSAPVTATKTARQAPSAPPIAAQGTLVKQISVDGITIAHYSTGRNSFPWDQAAVMCNSIGWWLAQLPTERLFNALGNLSLPSGVNHYNYDAFVGVRFNATSGDFEWTRSNTAVLPSFWSPGYPNWKPYEDYPCVNANMQNGSYYLHNSYSGMVAAFLCSSE